MVEDSPPCGTWHTGRAGDHTSVMAAFYFLQGWLKTALSGGFKKWFQGA
jgi:hypothetical protein